MTTQFLYWLIFIVVISMMLAIDLWYTDHSKTKMGLKQALIWSAIWIGIALLYNISIYFKFSDGHIKQWNF